jgi:transcriptional regulator with XRE-family HTH domain
MRKCLDLSQLNFALLTGISKPSVINIESGKTDYSLGLLEKITQFADCSLTDLSSNHFVPDVNLREKLAKKYEKDTRYEILQRKPSIVYAIQFKLLKSDFLDSYRETNEITHYFETHGWLFKGTSITNALSRMSDLIEVKPHASKNNTNLYIRKPNG